MKWKNDYNLVNDLADIGIFKSNMLTKEEFEKKAELNKNNDSLIYIKGEQVSKGKGNAGNWYEEVNTNGMDIDDIRLRIELNKAKNIHSIKGMVTFFVVLTIVSLILMVMQIL
mgnify:FL=1